MKKEDYDFWNKAVFALVEASTAEKKRNEEQISAMVDRMSSISDPIADYDSLQDQIDLIKRANKVEFGRILAHWLRLAEKRGNDKITKDLARWAR